MEAKRQDLESIVAQLYPIFGSKRQSAPYLYYSTNLSLAESSTKTSPARGRNITDYPELHREMLEYLGNLDESIKADLLPDKSSPAAEPVMDMVSQLDLKSAKTALSLVYSRLKADGKALYLSKQLEGRLSELGKNENYAPKTDLILPKAKRLQDTTYQKEAALSSSFLKALYTTEINKAVEGAKAEGKSYQRRQDKLDVVPVGKEISDGLYSLDLKVESESFSANQPEKTLMRVKTASGVETMEFESGSSIAKAYRALDDKGLVGIFEKTASGGIELTEILGLDGASLQVATGAGGTISINYRMVEKRAGDFEFINRELLAEPDSRNHGYGLARKVVSYERAADESLRALQVINQQGEMEAYMVKNNSAIAFLADSISEQGLTPEIHKSEVLSNDGSRIEESIFIKNAYRLKSDGQKEYAIKDEKYAGMLGELVGKNGSVSEAIDPMGCSRTLVEAKIRPGEVWDAKLAVIGRYDNRR